MPKARLSRLLTGILLVTGLGLCISRESIANPIGAQVVSGGASFNSSAHSLQIKQSTQSAIIQWNSFNIKAGEKTQFIQPNAQAIVLNRVNPGAGVSKIFGALSANGRVIIVNSAGIYFGPHSSVNVGSLIASTSDITNANFNAGKYHFDQASPQMGSIINEGKITTANYGLVALLGTGVVNNGYINAKLGNIVLASGNKFTVDMIGDGMINFTIDQQAVSAGKDQNGQTLKNAVSNAGSLIANGGTILLTGKVAKGIVDNVVNMRGVAEARSVSSHNGVIILSAGNEGSVNVTGRLLASGKRGGKIQITGKHIHLGKTALVDASGEQGGGDINIGGSVHGSGPLPNADTVAIDSGAVIKADATRSGNGGNVVIWSNDSTHFAGTVSAQGGTLGGNGGFAEVSSHEVLDFTGNVNLVAAHGTTGTLLLDPEDLTIQAGGVTTATISGSTVTSNVDSSILTVANLESLLTTSNVLIQTGSGGTQAGNITVASSFNWSNGNTLTLSAYHNIVLSGGVSITNSGGGTLNMISDNAGTGAGTVVFNAGSNVNFTSAGKVNIFYNPASYTSPTDFTASVTGVTPVAYMLVNSQTNLQNINTNLSGDYALGKNLSLSGNFTPLGNATTPFTGVFDGQNFTINHLSITDATANANIGLFGEISHAILFDVNLTNVAITESAAAASVGSLVGDAENSTISDASTGGTVHVTTDLTNQSINVGGLIGIMNNSTLQNASAVNLTLTISGTNYGASGGSPGVYSAGGLVGYLSGGAINDSYTSGGSFTSHLNINTAANMWARNLLGGFLGSEHNSAILQSDYSTNLFTITDTISAPGASSIAQDYLGGLVGRLDTTAQILDSYTTGNLVVNDAVSASDPTASAYIFAGGLAGIISVANSPSSTPPATVDSSYATGAVSMTSSLSDSAANANVAYIEGGLVGYGSAVIYNSHSTGAVTFNLSVDTLSTLYTVYVGGLLGSNRTLVNNSYSTSPISVTGNNFGGQFSIGGLVGYHDTLFDKEVTNSYSNSLMNVAVNNEDGGTLYIGGLIGTLIYYGSLPTTWPFINNYSTSTMNISGENIGSTTGIGGLIGSNGIDSGNPGGGVENSFAAGLIINQVATSGGGATYSGGLLGVNTGSTAVLSGNYWDTGTTGYNSNQGVGNMPGSVTGVTPGCLGGGTCVNGGSADLSLQSTFANSGWTFNPQNWAIIENASYPYLAQTSAGTPQAISGTTGEGAGVAVDLVVNGAVVGTVLTTANGAFYFLEQANTIPVNVLGLVYLRGSGTTANDVFMASSNGSVTGLSLTNNTLQIGGDYSEVISNSTLGSAISGLANTSFLLFSSSGGAVTLGTNTHPNVNLITTANTTYQLDSSLQTISGGVSSLAFGGSVVLSANESLQSSSIAFGNTLSGSGYNLTLTSANAVTFANTVNLANLIVNASQVNVNASSITTTGSQTYNAPVVLGVDSTFTAAGLTFNGNISGGKNLAIVGQPGTDSVAINGDINLASLTITGSSASNNALSINTSGSEVWNILNNYYGSVSGAGIVGSLNFSKFTLLTGGHAGNTFNFNNGVNAAGSVNGQGTTYVNTLGLGSYSGVFNVNLGLTNFSGTYSNSPSSPLLAYDNINYLLGNNAGTLTLGSLQSTLTLNSYNSGTVNGVLNFSQFNYFSTLNSHDIINFLAPAIYNVAKNVLTINGITVGLSGFDYTNFTGNISIIGSGPAPPPTPQPVIPPKVFATAVNVVTSSIQTTSSSYHYPVAQPMSGKMLGLMDATSNFIECQNETTVIVIDKTPVALTSTSCGGH